MGDYDFGSPAAWTFIFVMAMVGMILSVVGVGAFIWWLISHLAWV